MWPLFLKVFNGVSIIPDQVWSACDELQFFIDSSGEIGFGGFCQAMVSGEMARISVTQTVDTVERILFPIVAPMVLWGTSLRGKRIIVRPDNEAAVSIVNGQTSKCPEIMQLLRFFVLQLLKNKVAFSARHISGCENNVADAWPPLSGRTLSMLTVPQADPKELQVPEFLWRL